MVNMPRPEQYLEILAHRKQRQLQIEREKEEERLRIEQEAQERLAEMQRLSQRLLPEEEIERILAAKDPDELLALARNPHVPIQWIRKLLTCYQVKGARQIRENAERNVQTRSS